MFLAANYNLAANYKISRTIHPLLSYFKRCIFAG